MLLGLLSSARVMATICGNGKDANKQAAEWASWQEIFESRPYHEQRWSPGGECRKRRWLPWCSQGSHRLRWGRSLPVQQPTPSIAKPRSIHRIARPVQAFSPRPAPHPPPPMVRGRRRHHTADPTNATTLRGDAMWHRRCQGWPLGRHIWYVSRGRSIALSLQRTTPPLSALRSDIQRATMRRRILKRPNGLVPIAFARATTSRRQ